VRNEDAAGASIEIDVGSGVDPRLPMYRPVLLGLGANAGDALATLAAAVESIGDLDGVTVEEVSSVYETPAWPPPDDPRHVPQDDYLNLVVRARSRLTPDVLLPALLQIERLLGRDRGREQRWGPRPIDIDLLVHGDERRDRPELLVPHPRIAERAFVLVPMLEVWPGGQLPGGERIAVLLSRLAPIEDIRLFGRLEELPTEHLARPDGPSAPAAGFERPGLESVAREHGATLRSTESQAGPRQ
jgi:2-amino-4-hydroxy-6-hydroxymethyldihydropteridine diphosphokinase